MKPKRRKKKVKEKKLQAWNLYMLFTGREVRNGKTVPEVLDTTQGRRPKAVHKTEGTVFPNTDRPWLVNSIFIFF